MRSVLLAATFGLLTALPTWADVQLIPGTITGTVHLSSETIGNGSVSASATDGSGSASASFNGETYSITVPAGKTWKLNFSLSLQNASNATSYLSVSPAEQLSVGANQTVTQNFSITSTRVTADVQVANGTLSSFGYLQASGSTGSGASYVSFYSYAYSTGAVTVLPFTGVSVYGTVNLLSTTNQASTTPLASTSVDVPAGGATVTWSVDASFLAGAIQGALTLTGSSSMSSAQIYFYGPDGANASAGLTGNGSYQFDNLKAGAYSGYAYANFPNSSLYLSRYSLGVTAGAVTTVNFTYGLATANIGLNLTGFLTAAQLSSANLYSNWNQPNPNPDNASASASTSLNSSGGFTAVLTPGDWSFSQSNFTAYDYSDQVDYFYSQVSVYDYTSAATPVTFAAGDNQTLPVMNLNTTQTDITFDVVEPAGATAETLISYPSVSGYAYVISPSGQYLKQLSFYAANYGQPQAKPRVRIIGVPGAYTMNAYGTVGSSQVSFGNFTIELKAPLPTATGTNVTVTPGAGTTLVFDNVISSGVTTASQLPVGPALPGGYTDLPSGGQNAYYSISTTATFSGSVDVTLTYDPAAVPAGSASSLQLFYYDNATQTWVKITTSLDTTSNTITGTAPALSLFAVGLPHAPVLGAVTVPATALKADILSFSAVFTDGDASDTHTATWTWGDTNASNGSVSETDGTVTGQHAYAQAGTYHGTLTLTDAAGLTSTQDFTVVVGGGDSTPPAITVPADIVVEAGSSTGAVVTFAISALDETDGAVTATASPASGSLFPIGTTTVTVTATDAAGNVATKTFHVTVDDTTAPVIAALQNLVLEATGPVGAVATFTPSATDLVDGAVSVTSSVPSGSVFSLGTTTVKLTAKDATGNTATSTFTVTVQDTTPPVITAPASIVAEATSASGVAVTFSGSATDLVDGTDAVTASPASGSTFSLGVTTVTLTAKDAAGNTASKSFTVTVRDTTAPVITAPANLVAEATSANGAAVTFSASASDLVDGAVAVIATPASGSTFALGTTTVSLKATDAAGNTAAKTFTVTVGDTTAPVLTVPANIIAEAGSAAGAVVSFSPSATDATGATVTTSVASGSTFPLGTTTVKVTATDASGNKSTGSFTVTVRDTSGPVLTLPAAIVVEATSDDGTKVTYSATAADLVSGARPVSYSIASGSRFPLGTTVVTVTARDALGNVSKGTFTVTVRDTTPPTLHLPDSITAKATSSAGARVSFAAGANDLVDDHVQIAYSRAPGSVFPLGTTTVTVTATDDSGNVATGTFTVTVQDTTKPVFTVLSVSPSILTNANHQMVPVTVTALVKDNIDPSPSAHIVSVTSDEPIGGTGPGDLSPDWQITGALTLNLRAELDPKGNGRIYTIAVAVTDASGNTRTQTVHVLVPKKSSTRFEDCDNQHRTENQRCTDEDNSYDSRDRGDDN